MTGSKLLATCALAWAAVACSSSGAGGDESGPLGAGSDDAGSDGGVSDAASDSSRAHAPAAPSCPSGDRNEWAGVIPNTLLAVAVCSACGESYVVAASGSASTEDISVNNGTSTIKASVPAGGTVTTAKIADDPANGTVSVCATSGSKECLPVAPQNQKYCNPYRSVTGLVPERIDQGVDYAGAGPIYAVGPGTIDLYFNRTNTGWPGGTFVSYKLSAGPAAGKVVYLAENIDLNPSLHAGSFVYGGTVLGTLVKASPNSESGWGVQGAGYTAEHSCYTEGCTTALGSNFNDLLVCMKTPSGITETTGCCTSSAGWPANWCALLAAWQ